MDNLKRPILILYNSTLRSLNNSFRLVFHVLYLITKPNLLLIRVIQFIKSKPFSILLLGASGYLVAYSALETSPILLRKFYPEYSQDAIQAMAFRVAVFSEVALIILKLQKKKLWSFLVMLLVICFALGGLFYDVLINLKTYPIFKIVGIGLFQGSPTLISIILLWSSGNDASKVAKYTKFDKSFTGRKKKRESLSKEQREELYKQVLEHVDYQYSVNPGELSFNSIKEAFSDRIRSSQAISRLLQKERPLIYASIKENSKGKRGRKSKNKIAEKSNNLKARASDLKTKAFSFLSGLKKKQEATK